MNKLDPDIPREDFPDYGSSVTVKAISLSLISPFSYLPPKMPLAADERFAFIF